MTKTPEQLMITDHTKQVEIPDGYFRNNRPRPWQPAQVIWVEGNKVKVRRCSDGEMFIMRRQNVRPINQ